VSAGRWFVYHCVTFECSRVTLVSSVFTTVPIAGLSVQYIALHLWQLMDAGVWEGGC
jgi:hypothetical protein